MSTPRTKTLLQNLAAYAIAAAIICYASRGVSWSQVAAACRHSSLSLFLLASTAGFLIWFIGETFLYSRLFSYFHAPTTPRELIPTMAAVYFLQIVNSWVAGGAFVLFLHVRKRVPWLMSGCTLLFQGYLDAILFAALTLIAIAVVPTSPIRLGLIYAGAALGAGCLIASFFLSWGSRLRTTNWLRWMILRSPLDVDLPPRAAVAIRQTIRHQAADSDRRRPRALRTIRQLSYQGAAPADPGPDPIHRGHR